MDEGLCETDPRETPSSRTCQQKLPVMARQRQVHGEFQMHGCRRTADPRIPLRTAMSGIDDQWHAHIVSQGLKRIEKCRVVPVITCAEAMTTPA